MYYLALVYIYDEKQEQINSLLLIHLLLWQNIECINVNIITLDLY